MDAFDAYALSMVFYSLLCFFFFLFLKISFNTVEDSPFLGLFSDNSFISFIILVSVWLHTYIACLAVYFGQPVLKIRLL